MNCSLTQNINNTTCKAHEIVNLYTTLTRNEKLCLNSIKAKFSSNLLKNNSFFYIPNTPELQTDFNNYLKTKKIKHKGEAYPLLESVKQKIDGLFPWSPEENKQFSQYKKLEGVYFTRFQAEVLFSDRN